jgi:inward rectifier potassium channel
MIKIPDKSRIQDPGFGEKIGGKAQRAINKDGSFNTVRKNGSSGLRNIYQHLLQLHNSYFFLAVLLTYVLCSLIFAALYYAIGTEHLIGVRGETALGTFMDCFYFSTQTFTTVGYGAIAPKGILASTVASFEAFCGLLFFAIATGLMYARFSKPKAMLAYSNNALIAPYQDGKALMFRLANKRNNVLMEMNARAILMMRETNSDAPNRKYFALKLEIEHIIFLPLSWTLVHKIDDSSPLFGLTEKQLIELDAEVLILISGFDDTFHQTVHSRYSYTANEFVWDAKFMRAFSLNEKGKAVMDLNELHSYEKL